jgi:single-stranded DNA-binding protein
MVGRLVRDPEVRKTKNDQDYVTYDLAVSQGFTAADEHGSE